MLKCNSDLTKRITRRCNVAASKRYVALALRCGYVIPEAQWLDSSAVGISQLVAHEAAKSILCVRDGYAPIHKLRVAATLLYKRHRSVAAVERFFYAV